MMNKTIKRVSIPKSEKGFTLVEILVAVAISGIVMSGIYSAFYTQQRSYVVQEQVVAVQQNLRAAMYFMEREIRMAGCDPTRSAGAAIITADPATLNFTEDVGDGAGGDPNGTIEIEHENITYYLEGNRLRRRTIEAATGNPLPQTLAENIEALDFVYLDADGNVAATTDDIASVEIAIVARTQKPDRQYSITRSFTNMQGDLLGTYTDNYRREILTTRVKCRNIGL
jgi:type IV pilus assembly protein PilW